MRRLQQQRGTATARSRVMNKRNVLLRWSMLGGSISPRRLVRQTGCPGSLYPPPKPRFLSRKRGWSRVNRPFRFNSPYSPARIGSWRLRIRSFLPTPPHGGVVWFTGGPALPVAGRLARIRAGWRFQGLDCCGPGLRPSQSPRVRMQNFSASVRQVVAFAGARSDAGEQPGGRVDCDTTDSSCGQAGGLYS